MPQDDRTTQGDGPGAEGGMELLAEHVPLALLLDLVVPDGPSSDEILRTEGVPDDAWWEPSDAADVPADDDDGATSEPDAQPAGAPGSSTEPTA